MFESLKSFLCTPSCQEVTRNLNHSLFSLGGEADQGILYLLDERWSDICSRRDVQKCGIFSPCHAPSNKIKKKKKTFVTDVKIAVVFSTMSYLCL